MVFGGWKLSMDELAGQLVLGSAFLVLAAANVALESMFSSVGSKASQQQTRKNFLSTKLIAVREGSDNNPRGRPQKVLQASFKMPLDHFITFLRHFVGAGD
ncbi:hypothetical protein J6590_067197 [Homalodisca vitripennis]|nr:hypothetical protein J6590_067197 [Homalodisca vitripennis]